MTSIFCIFAIITLAFIFDFINGFHDAANSVATVVATGTLRPAWAILWVAFFNFIAFLFFHLNVANTIGVGLVAPSVITPYIIFAALSSAIIFNLITWYHGLPSSSSHSLIGGLVGAAIMHEGWDALVISGLTKVIIAIILSPLLGMLFTVLLLTLANKLLRKPDTSPCLGWIKTLHLFSAALLSLGHGANDAQKTMGIIAVLLFSSGLLGSTFYVPFWVVISCNLVMGLGTMCGGWRIIKTLGEKITQLNPYNGSAAQTGSAIVLFTATYLGIPVSTTHIVTGAITGASVEHQWRLTNWGMLRKIAFAWFITIPVAALIAASIVWLKGIL